jgi:hypothetical protein
MIKHLNAILTEDNRKAGFTIEEEGDHFVHLLWHGAVVGTFTQMTTAKHLNEAADELRWTPTDINPTYEAYRASLGGDNA